MKDFLCGKQELLV